MLALRLRRLAFATRFKPSLPSVSANQQKMADLQELRAGTSTLDSGIDTTAWEATRDVITANLQNSDLSRRVAFHFGRLATLNRAAALHLDLSLGVPSALQSAADNRGVVAAFIVNFSGELMAEANQLVTDINALDVMKPQLGSTK